MDRFKKKFILKMEKSKAEKIFLKIKQIFEKKELLKKIKDNHILGQLRKHL